MKKIFFVSLIIFILSSNVLFADYEGYDSDDAWHPTFFEIYLNASIGSLVSGDQKDFVHEGLSPTPDSYSTGLFDIGFSAFFFDFIGLDVSYSFLGETSAESDETESLDIYEFSKVNAGLKFRYFYNKGIDSSSVYLGAGINYCFFDLHDDFKDLIESSAMSQGYIVSFNDKDATGIGYYVTLGVNIYINDFVFGGIGLNYSYLNVKFPNATDNLDGSLVFLQFAIGVAF